MTWKRIIIFLPVPGIGHLVLGRSKKGLGLLLCFLGIAGGMFFAGMFLIKVLLLAVCFSLIVTSTLEVYQLYVNGSDRALSDSRWYTVILLLFTGFAALPLLWQNSHFSKKSKIAWSIMVPVLATLFFFLVFRYRAVIERTLRNILSA